MSVEELIAELERDPDNIELYLVLADTLIHAGDPRGELIQVQHALSRIPEPPVSAPRVFERPATPLPDNHKALADRERELIAAWRERTLGPYNEDVVRIDLQYGWATRAAVNEWSAPSPGYSMARALAWILKSPEARLLRTVEIHPRPARSAVVEESIASVIAYLVSSGARVPRSVRRLVLGKSFATHPGLRFGRATESLRGVLDVFPSVEELVVDLGPVELRWDALASARLKRFAWISPCVQADELAPLASARLPALEAFTLWTGAAYAFVDEHLDDGDEIGSPIERLSLDELEPVFAMLDRCEALRELGIVNYASDVGALLEALADHPLAKRIEVLDVSRASMLEPAGVLALLDQFPALRELWLDDERFRDAARVRILPRDDYQFRQILTVT